MSLYVWRRSCNSCLAEWQPKNASSVLLEGVFGLPIEERFLSPAVDCLCSQPAFFFRYSDSFHPVLGVQFGKGL